MPESRNFSRNQSSDINSVYVPEGASVTPLEAAAMQAAETPVMAGEDMPPMPAGPENFSPLQPNSLTETIGNLSGVTIDGGTVIDGQPPAYMGGILGFKSVNVSVVENGSSQDLVISAGGQVEWTWNDWLGKAHNTSYPANPFSVIVSGMGNGISGATVEGGGGVGATLVVGNGGEVDNITLSSGGVALANGGVMSGATAVDGGSVFVNADAENVVAGSGGYVKVSGAGVVSGATVSDGGRMEASNGGDIGNGTVLDGGTLRAFGGGTLMGGTASSGGTLIVSSGGILLASDSNHNVISGTAGTKGSIFVSNGGSAEDLTADAGFIQIMNGGTGNNIFAIGKNGQLDVNVGGKVDHATAQAEGRVLAEAGGTVEHATVLAGGTVWAMAGGVIDGGTGSMMAWMGGTIMAGDKDHNVTGATAAESGTLFASNGGTMTDALVSGAGTLIDGTGGVVSNLTVSGYPTGLAGWPQIPTIQISGGVVRDVTIAGNVSPPYSASAAMSVYAGGVASNVAVSQFATIYVGDKGQVSGGTAASGGTLLVTGDTAEVYGATADNGGRVIADNKATINNALATDGGTVYAVNSGVIDGGTGQLTKVVLGSATDFSGNLVASKGGTVMAGDKDHNVAGAIAIDGGTVYAESGGTADHVIISGVGSATAAVVIDVPLEKGTAAYGCVGAGGTFEHATVLQAGTLNVGSGGVVKDIYASGHTDQFGISGILNVNLGSGGSAIVNVDAGGTVLGGEVDIFATMTEKGPGAYVSGVVLGGTYNPKYLNLPGVRSIFGGYFGGTLFVDGGASASNITVYGGALAMASGDHASIMGGTAIGTAGPYSGHPAGGVIDAGASGAVVMGGTALSGGVIVAGVSGATAGGTAYAGGTITVGAQAGLNGLADLIPQNDGRGAVISNATLFSGATLYSSGSGVFGPYLSNVDLVVGATYESITFESGQLFGADQGSMTHATAMGGAAVAIYGAGHFISGATATAFVDTNGKLVQGSIDAVNGGTVFNGTAASGGVLAAGGLSALTTDAGNVPGVMQDARIMNGGFGFAGGGKNMVIRKNNSTIAVSGAGLFSDAVVDAGGTMDVNGRGTFQGGTVAGFGLVESDGTMEQALFTGKDASVYVDQGGSAQSNILSDGAILSLGGGIGSGNTVMDGGTVEIGAGISQYATQGPDGNMVIAQGSQTFNGTSISGVISRGGKQIVDSGGADSLATVFQGGTMIVKSGGYAVGATIGAGQDTWVNGNSVHDDYGQDGAIISSGALFENGTLANGYANNKTSVEQMGGIIRVERGATVTGLHMGDFGQIEVMGVKYGAGESAVYQNGTVFLESNGDKLWSATLAGSYNSSSFQIWNDDGTAVIVYDQCFLKGTKISTPNGEIAIETLRTGDAVWAFVNGQKVKRVITAFQQKESEVNSALPPDLAGYPVCICKDAFGTGLPKQDLRVTAEHCFYFEGRFIPVRMLVNGVSIYYDTACKHFSYYHLETDPHSILMAEGVLTESWLDTTERRQAVNLPDGITRLERVPARVWEKDAAAPLDVSVGFAQNLWNKFNDRAFCLGFKAQASHVAVFDTDPNLKLRLTDGRELLPKNRRGGQYFFQIPPGAHAAALISKIFRPSESIGPWVDDRRQLGVLVGKLTVAVGGEFRQIDGHLRAANAQGWDVVENSPCRWTKGEAALPPLGSEEKYRFGYSLIVEVLAGGPYPEQESPAASSLGATRMNGA